ncbi:hypothetical protein [Breoghania sp.]|uniref:hypothetical protein n=1 Tax=Breoghania sp. TaxID=2065378 RepID=UPI002633F256|nr:hypothetical protein [Breoghania sp.]MDJ0930356.1 hypothetical protein [Breoghania sp.]
MAVVFPFERPYQPFQSCALAINGCSQGPMGALSHREYGPWAGFRAAFISAGRIAGVEQDDTAGPYQTCHDRPCLSACPAHALSLNGYDVPRCLAYLEETPGNNCLAGCRARFSCPYGTAFRQSRDQASFHMRAFTGWNDDT